MKTTSYLSLFIVILLNSCSKPDQNSIEQPLKVNMPDLPLDFRIRDPNLIRFSSNPFSEIVGIDKILFLENRIIILDQMKGNAVFIYDLEGNYINHIYRIGEGPGEYRRVENIFYSSYDNQLVLIPMDFKKKMYFDLNGKFLNEEFYEHSTVYSDLFLLKNGEITINNSSINGDANLLIRENDEIELEEFPFNPILDDSPLDQKNLISQIDDHHFLLSIGLRDTLYTLDLKDLTVYPSYILDFGHGPSFELNEKPDPIQFFLDNDVFVGAIDLFQNKQFISFTTLHNKGLQGRIFSKISRKLISTEKLIQQEIGTVGFGGVKGITRNNEFVAVLNSGGKGAWDFTENSKLREKFEQFKDVEQEELILLIFSIEEN